MDFSNHIVLALSVAVAVFVSVLAFWLAFRAPLTEQYARLADIYRRSFVLELQFPDQPGLVIVGYVLATLALTVLVIPVGPLIAPVIPVLAYFLPRAVFVMEKEKRRKKVDDVLPNVLQQLSANTKNVGSISLALQEVAATAPEPMDYELELISRQEQELKSFTKALSNARTRLQSKWFDIVTAVLLTADEKGGKISSALANLSRVFVQLKTMQNRIDTATSQGRMSMRIMLAMPFVVVGIVYIVDPRLIGLATSNSAGVAMLSGAVFFYALAIGVAIWLSRVKI